MGFCIGLANSWVRAYLHIHSIFAILRNWHRGTTLAQVPVGDQDSHCLHSWINWLVKMCLSDNWATDFFKKIVFGTLLTQTMAGCCLWRGISLVSHIKRNASPEITHHDLLLFNSAQALWGPHQLKSGNTHFEFINDIGPTETCYVVPQETILLCPHWLWNLHRRWVGCRIKCAWQTGIAKHWAMC